MCRPANIQTIHVCVVQVLGDLYSCLHKYSMCFPGQQAGLVVQTVWGQVSPLTATQAGIEPGIWGIWGCHLGDLYTCVVQVLGGLYSRLHKYSMCFPGQQVWASPQIICHLFCGCMLE